MKSTVSFGAADTRGWVDCMFHCYKLKKKLCFQILRVLCIRSYGHFIQALTVRPVNKKKIQNLKILFFMRMSYRSKVIFQNCQKIS